MVTGKSKAPVATPAASGMGCGAIFSLTGYFSRSSAQSSVMCKLWLALSTPGQRLVGSKSATSSLIWKKTIADWSSGLEISVNEIMSVQDDELAWADQPGGRGAFEGSLFRSAEEHAGTRIMVVVFFLHQSSPIVWIKRGRFDVLHAQCDRKWAHHRQEKGCDGNGHKDTSFLGTKQTWLTDSPTICGVMIFWFSEFSKSGGPS
jgi:hypothetical protein